MRDGGNDLGDLAPSDLPIDGDDLHGDGVRGDDGASPADRGPDADGPAPLAVCEHVIDLSTAGMRQGAITTYLGDSTAAAADAELAAPVGCSEADVVNRQVAFSYTPSASVNLLIRTDYPATGELDTVVWVLDACAATAATRGCNDDSSTGRGSSLSVAAQAGQPVVIVVGVFTPDRMTPAAGGPFQLTVEELAALADGDPCDAFDVNRCAAGSSCVGRNQLGVCTKDGSAPLALCRAGSTDRCDAGMVCAPAEPGVERCYTEVAAGMPCDFATARCAGEALCLPTFASPMQSTLLGVCRDPGTAGGTCDLDTPCGSGLVCSDPTDLGICQATSGAAMPCEPLPVDVTPTRCPQNATCLPSMGGFDCRLPGFAAGTPCRAMAPLCDGMLTCENGTCRLPPNGSCHPRFNLRGCPAGQVCAATDFLTGSCQSPVAELPGGHGDFASAQVVPLIQGQAAISGALTTDVEVDCYKVSVAEGQSIYADVGDGQSGCPGDTELYLFDSQGRVVDYGDDSPLSTCSILDGNDPLSPSHALPAGVYAVCVTPYSGGGGSAIGAYVLSIAVQ